MIIHDVEQGTAEWLQLKAGKFGGTSAKLLAVGNGISVGLQTAIYQKCADIVTGPKLDSYTSDAMLRGIALEPRARQAYTLETFQDVEEVGFIEYSEYFGVSPDGLVGDDGAVEIKCPQAKEFVRWMVEKEKDPIAAIPKGYYLQMQWLLLLTRRKWCDYVVYNPDFAPLDLSIVRVDRDEEVLAKFKLKMYLITEEMNRVLNIIAEKENA